MTAEVRALPASGTPLLCELSLSLVRDSAGEPVYGLGQLVDVTATRRERARAQRHVRCQQALAAIGRRAVEEPSKDHLIIQSRHTQQFDAANRTDQRRRTGIAERGKLTDFRKVIH